MGRKRNLYQYRNDDEQEQDHDEYRGRNNPGRFLHDYPSCHVNRHLDNVQSNCNNGGAVLAESSNHHQFLSDEINHNQEQEGSRVHLNLDITDPLLKQIGRALTQEKLENNHQQVLSQPQPPPIKSKASNMFAVSLTIGSWIWESKHVGDLVVKFYYGKKKLVWEFLVLSRKKKIEIQWSNISAINTYVDKDQNRHLEIELGVPPEYYKEVNFEPLKHTQWEKTNDFTQGQAQCCRRHAIVFSPGVLDSHFMKLLQYDKRLFNIFNLSRQRFPINSEFFNPNDDHQGTLVPYVPNLVQPTSSFGGHSNSDLQMPGMAIPKLGENEREDPYVNDGTNGEQNGNNQIQDLPLPPINVQEDSQLYDGQEPLVSDRELQLYDVEKRNLTEVTTGQNCFNVDSTCNPLEQNHQNNFNPPGNEMNNGNHHVDPSSGNCGLNYMPYAYQGTLVPYVQNLVQPTCSFVGNSNSDLQMPGMAIPNVDENEREDPYVNEGTNGEQNGNNQIKDLPLPPINVQEDSQLYDGLEPLVSDRELQLYDAENRKLTEVTIEQNCFNVDSTCKPLEQNHQNNLNPPGNEMNNGNHHVDPSSGNCGLDYMAYAYDDVYSFTEPQFNDELALQEQCYWASLQFDMHDFNNGGNAEHPLQGSKSWGAGPST
ncbi:hypothetical protein L2E82_24619 [Cichorium intybus]|uniref:Uncharacterized protein n=1 Tax=Cichorium intybus TaxID=13427 RepID=A0ACB9E1J3_CICIN|nr:hypothetical protein L2E82_24619 [Cichorium intybus]